MSNLIVLNEKNEDEYDRLVVSLEAGLGTLQILLAVCDNSALKQEVIRRYEAELEGVQSYRLALNPDEPSLLQALIDGKIDKNIQAIATVLGAEKLSNLGADNRERLDSFLGYLQWTREALRGYPLPIVLWLPSALLVEIAKKAPDFWSWRGGVFTFKFADLVFPPILAPPQRERIDEEKSSSALSIKQLESSLAEALTVWSEDSSNIEPIYAQLGKAYAERVYSGKADDRIQETTLAETYLNKAIALQKRYNRKNDLTYALNSLGYMYKFLGYWDKSETLYKESLQLREELGDRAGMAEIWGLLGDIERNRGNWDAAESLYRQSLQVCTEIGNRAGVAMVSFDFALLEKQRGNLSLAQQYYDRAKTIYQQLGAVKDLERIETEWNS